MRFSFSSALKKEREREIQGTIKDVVENSFVVEGIQNIIWEFLTLKLSLKGQVGIVQAVLKEREF